VSKRAIPPASETLSAMDQPLSTTPEHAIDPEALNQLSALGGDDPRFLEEMIVLFLEQAPQHLQALRSALSAGDLASIAKAAHQLKSSSFYLGARRFSELCARTEAQARAGNGDAVTESITALEAEFELVREALRRRLGA